MENWAAARFARSIAGVREQRKGMAVTARLTVAGDT
jgi:hypothetical protein